jgi:hypothetical protein
MNNAVTGRFERQYTLDEYAFSEITEQSAYWLGFLYADGCLHGDNITLALKSSDKSHVAKFTSFLHTDMPIKDTIIAKKYNVSKIEIHSSVISKELDRWCIRSPKSTDIPVELGSFRNHWIRGFFDGDGTISYKKKRIAFCGVKNIIEKVRYTIAAQTGRTGSMYKHTKSDIWYVEYRGRLQCLDIIYLMYSNSTVYLDRKKDQADMFRTKPLPRTRNEKGQFN